MGTKMNSKTKEDKKRWPNVCRTFGYKAGSQQVIVARKVHIRGDRRTVIQRIRLSYYRLRIERGSRDVLDSSKRNLRIVSFLQQKISGKKSRHDVRYTVTFFPRFPFQIYDTIFPSFFLLFLKRIANNRSVTFPAKISPNICLLYEAGLGNELLVSRRVKKSSDFL